eukprot:TRINITY_DN67207_c6_g2_i2.p1 TRINITY_DN67207_c6_g2~~TRINITY_DN67207_c6_g2_i2.p1  ORF type:complete len:495 (+),score=42.23 TRINITY_DN67207_c6_g2_i2:44-1528(+)
MQALAPIQLQPSGLPVFLHGEIETLSQDSVALYDGDTQTDCQHGRAILTNQRLLWVQSHDADAKHQSKSAQSRALGLLLALVTGVERKHGHGFGYLSSPKVIVSVQKIGKVLKLSFRKGGDHNFEAKFQDILSRKPWLQLPPPVDRTATVSTLSSANRGSKGFSTSSAGVSGIVRHIETEQRKTETTINEAFDDLKSLMDNAGALVSIANKFNQMKSKMSETEQDEYDEWMTNLGIVAPVSKATMGKGAANEFHAQLARQLCDFLIEPLNRKNGTLSLVDVFCLYNRARGTDLVSPDDIAKACNLFGPLNLPLKVKRFDSGVLVVQSKDKHSTKAIQESIRVYLAGTPEKAGHAFVTPRELATLLGVPLQLANEYLLDAEKSTLLCRDESMEGISFYLNFFQHPTLINDILPLLPTTQTTKISQISTLSNKPETTQAAPTTSTVPAPTPAPSEPPLKQQKQLPPAPTVVATTGAAKISFGSAPTVQAGGGGAYG